MPLIRIEVTDGAHETSNSNEATNNNKCSPFISLNNHLWVIYLDSYSQMTTALAKNARQSGLKG